MRTLASAFVVTGAVPWSRSGGRQHCAVTTGQLAAPRTSRKPCGAKGPRAQPGVGPAGGDRPPLGAHASSCGASATRPCGASLDSPSRGTTKADSGSELSTVVRVRAQPVPDPPGGRIFVDGEAMGVTPKELAHVCSGRHRVEVKHSRAASSRTSRWRRTSRATLDCPIRPSLAFLGVVAESPAGERVLRRRRAAHPGELRPA